MEIDEAVFDKCKELITMKLQEYPFDEELKARLYIGDKNLVEFIKLCEDELLLEYGSDKDIYKQYSISKIVKLINSDKPSNWYRIYTGYDWKQINDKDKVFKLLNGELERTFHKHKLDVRKKIKSKEIKEEQEKKILHDIDLEYKEAQKINQYILDNFDNLDTRISSYKDRKAYAKIDFKINKKRQTNKNLNKTVPNVIWFEELPKEDKKREDNELLEYFKHAKNPFGYVYYIEEDIYKKPNKKQKDITDE